MMHSEDLPVEALVVDPVQARAEPWAGDTADRQLAAAIAADGIYHDLLVRPLEAIEADLNASESAEYAIVAGSRRYHAAMDAGYETVPCKVLSAGDVEAAWASLLENTDRKELSEQERAQQLAFIYESVGPNEPPTACPQCGQAVDGEHALHTHYGQSDCTPPALPDGDPEGRFSTDRQACRYLAQRFLGRDDDGAVSLIRGHLRTASLPAPVQALFKTPDERSPDERTTLSNYGIDTQTTLGSGDGNSGTSQAIVALHETIATEADSEAIAPTEAVLETVGELQPASMSEQELRRTLRDVRRELSANLETADSVAAQRQLFTETLQQQAADRQARQELATDRPFKKVDVLGPKTQRHSRWHSRAMATRDIDGHGELVRQLYQERLETLADDAGWD